MATFAPSGQHHHHHELNTRNSDALLLNSGLFGAHARSSSFSSHLSGRFYKNSTLAAHAAREKRAARMRAKKRELEEAIMVEERRAELLEERLRERLRSFWPAMDTPDRMKKEKKSKD